MKRLIWAAATTLFPAAIAFGHVNDSSHMGGWPLMGGGMWCFAFWSLIGGVALLLVVLAVKYFMRKRTAGTSEKSGLDILKERYAKGEISKAEFEEMKRALSE